MQGDRAAWLPDATRSASGDVSEHDDVATSTTRAPPFPALRLLRVPAMEALRIVLLVFFLTHIPATLLVDAQAGAPSRRGLCVRLAARRTRSPRRVR